MDKNPFLEAVGKRLSLFREAQGLSREQFAEKVGLTPAGYGKIERGETNIPLITLQEIAQALKLPISEIVKVSEEGYAMYMISCSQFSSLMTNNGTITNNINNNDWVANTFKEMQETLKMIDKRLNRLESK